MSDIYDPHNWYWHVVEVAAPNNVYSSATAAFINATTDTTYLDWLSRDNLPTEVPVMEELIRIQREANVFPYHHTSTARIVERIYDSSPADQASWEAAYAGMSNYERYLWNALPYVRYEDTTMRVIFGFGAGYTFWMAPESPLENYLY
jgi:hypothetical protein